MQWRELKRETNRKEKDLEDLIRAFMGGQAVSSKVYVAGVPIWMPPTALEDKQGYRAVGYGYIPDGICDHEGRRFVWEFKLRDKGEPIALAEVLHHSYFQRHDLNMDTVPVVIGQFNEWTRAALAYLTEGGLPPEKVRYLEVDLLGAAEDTEHRLLWFDEPLAPWHSVDKSEVPEEVRQRVGSNSLEAWFFVDATKTWWATDGDVAGKALHVPSGGGRPLFYRDGRLAAFAKVRAIDRAGDGPDAWIAWDGRFSPGKRGSIRSEEAFWFGA